MAAVVTAISTQKMVFSYSGYHLGGKSQKVCWLLSNLDISRRTAYWVTVCKCCLSLNKQEKKKENNEKRKKERKIIKIYIWRPVTDICKILQNVFNNGGPYFIIIIHAWSMCTKNL